MAGFRGQNPLTRFLFFRLVLPFVGLRARGGLRLRARRPAGSSRCSSRLFVCVVRRLCGLLCARALRQQPRHQAQAVDPAAWPDALDLMLICVESGMSVEAAFRKVADEIGAQSVELAEEFVLTNAELSFLQERKQAYENLANRTGLESVKSVTPRR
jgi:tight adherence protein C